MQLSSRLYNFYLATQNKLWKLEKPVVIKFLVNDSIVLSKLAQTLANPLFSEVRSIEIDGKEPTTDKNLAELVDVLLKKLPKLSCISLVTSLLSDSHAIASISQISQIIKSYSGHLDIVVFLNGIGDTYDRIQGYKGSFERSVKVIDFVQSSYLVSSCSLRCMISKENIYDLHNLLEFAISRKIYIKYSIEKLQYPSYLINSESSNLTFKEKYHLIIFLENLIRFYEKSGLQRLFYQSLIGQLIHSEPCTIDYGWRHKEVTLSAKGKLQYSAPPPNKVLLESYTQDVLRNFELLFRSIKSLAVLQPLKLFKQQLDFHRQMSKMGVNQFTLQNPRPALSFPKFSTGKRRVLICGWYGTETLGDKAILGGVVNSIQAVLGNFEELHLASLEMYVSQMTILQMPELHGCTLHSVTNVINLAGSMDLVVFGGGPLMAINPLAEMIAIFQKAVAAKVPTLIAGCGVGPLGAPHHNEAIKCLLLHASHRIYRDYKSMQLARSLGVDTANDQVAEDPAFTWLETCTPNPSTTLPISAKQHPTLILGLRDWPYDQFAPELNPSKAQQLKRRFEHELITALELLLNKYPNLRIIPFPMCTNHLGRDDRWFYRDLFRDCAELQSALDLTYLGAELSPLEAVSVFESASVALTMRFHSLIFALATGVPAVSVDYTLGRGKVKSLAEKYHVPQMGLDCITCEFMFSSLSTLLDADQRGSTFIWRGETLTFKYAVNSFISSLN